MSWVFGGESFKIDLSKVYPWYVIEKHRNSKKTQSLGKILNSRVNFNEVRSLTLKHLW